jgi:hypothetical protein
MAGPVQHQIAMPQQSLLHPALFVGWIDRDVRAHRPAQ